MKIDIITLFPKMFEGPLTESMISRAQKRKLVKIKIHQLRDWAINSRGQVDDKPYGGGPGMLLRVDVAYAALQQIIKKSKIKNQKFKSKLKNKETLTAYNLQLTTKPYIILPAPSGKKFDQAMARRLAKKKRLVFLCPHYEGYDKRIESLVDETVSLGDFVLTGGELPVAVIVDAVVRLVPGVIKKESLAEESFSEKNQKSNLKNQNYGVASQPYLEYAQYTRPEIFEAIIKGKKTKKRVPKVLLSGNHALIEKWRKSGK
jgi:tRNA (guanine37-N1)-methyltransferase